EIVGSGSDDRPVPEPRRKDRQQKRRVEMAGVVGGEDHRAFQGIEMLETDDGSGKSHTKPRPGDVVEDDSAGQAHRVPARPSRVVVDAELSPRQGRNNPTGARRLLGEETGAPLAERRFSPHPLCHVTSAKARGGTCRWVMVGSRPTTSSASSRASASVEAGEKPRRRTAARFPPTTITLPRCCRACAHQYHM